ncbi:19375_t:CDS:2 [Dentiscutata erythropus]|uniref:19375_t:CDS:1 n=1 Tax=Dentiscutata erythropus TaxID=1348616 RepID=A0A9N9A5Z1_9GLOM|nr:19375_t:CDS:2 [Dentiscutata erythropus]
MEEKTDDDYSDNQIKSKDKFALAAQLYEEGKYNRSLIFFKTIIDEIKEEHQKFAAEQNFILYTFNYKVMPVNS